MIKQIEIPDNIYPRLTAKCECNNRTWKEICIVINPVIVAKLIICWKLDFGFECSNCKLFIQKGIGIFNDNMRLNKNFPHNQELIKRLMELNINDQVIKTFQEIKYSHNY